MWLSSGMLSCEELLLLTNRWTGYEKVEVVWSGLLREDI
jgi:hypothetical protein